MSRLSQLLREYASSDQHQSHVTWQELADLRKHLDSLWDKLGIDISFTHHFFDRVNDPRNRKQITIQELQKLFAATYQKHGQNIAVRVKPGTDHEFEAVLTDLSTKVNLPFVLKWDRNRRELVLVAKTVMRKDNFLTPDPKLTVQHFEPKGEIIKENGMKPKKTYRDLVEWIGWNTPEVAPITTPQAVDDVDTGAQYVENSSVLDKLNGYCRDIANHQYINPYYPLNTLWKKLNIIGINFDLKKVMMVGDTGRVAVPLTQFGGRFGFLTPGSGEVTHDDGISHRVPGGLNMVITWTKTGGVYSLDAKIEHGASIVGFGEGEVKKK